MSNNTFSKNSQKIAKNTIMLYLRMLVNLFVGFYSSRLILNALGIVDYGIYSVVGGVVWLFYFFNSTLLGATSRFFTYEIGLNKNLSKIFSASIITHVLAAILILILAETIGLFILNKKLVIPEDKFFSASVVYQLSIITTLINIIQIPFSALIISYERMNIFAYISLLETGIKLLIAILLFNASNTDKLILYSVLMFCTSILIYLIYFIYVRMSFTKIRFTLRYGYKHINKIMLFSGSDLFGNFCVVSSSQGLNLLLNLFYGTIINTAAAITAQIQNSVMNFANNFLLAVRPQIVKSYASGNLQDCFQLILNSSKYSFVLIYMMILPIIAETPYILDLWLKQVPPYSVTFIRISLLSGAIAVLFRPIMFAIYAVGKIQLFSFVTGVLHLLILPLSYLILKFHYPPFYTYIISGLFVCISNIVNLFFIKKYIPSFPILKFINSSVFPCLILLLFTLTIPFILVYSMNTSFLRCFIITILNIITIIIYSYFMIFDAHLKNKIRIRLKSIL